MLSPSVAIITDNNILAIQLANKLKKLKCTVEIISSVNLKDLNEKKRFDYAIFIYLSQRDNIPLVKNYSSKTIYIFPYSQTENTFNQIDALKKKFKEGKEETALILYLGELIDQNNYISKHDCFNQILVDAVFKQRVEVFKKDAVFHPISVNTATRQIVKSLFSFGYYGREAAIISNGLTQSKLIEILRRYKPALMVRPNKKSEDMFLADTKGKIVIKQNLDKEIVKALTNIGADKEIFTMKTPQPQRLGVSFRQRLAFGERLLSLLHSSPGSETRGILKSELKTKKRTRNFNKKSYEKWLVRMTAAAAVLIIWPTLLIFIIAFPQKLEWKLLERGNFYMAQKFFKVSKNTSSLLVSYLEFLPDIPGENIFLHPIDGVAKILTRSSEIGISLARLGRMYHDLYNKVGEMEEYNLEGLAMEISLELDYLYKELGFIESEIRSISGLAKNIFANWILYENDDDFREKITQVKRIVNELPDLLGQNKDKTYLMLFQNNLSIRPSGGAIVSVAFITFSKGKLSNIETLNTEVVDSYLKGFVAPPGPIAKYFESESFNLRDSNWDPNFAGAAEQAEWFIDKEIDRQVDGTITIDVDLIYEILLFTGGVHLDNLGIDINAKNLRQVILERTSNEIWSELLAELLGSLIKLDDSKKTQLFRNLLSGLEEKHILVFFHNIKTQRSISEMGWDGALPDASCPGNCLADWVGLVESLTIENDTSALTRRAADLDVAFEEGLVKRRYVILLENTASSGPEGKVSSLYLRVVAPEESGFSPVVVKTDDEEKEIVPEVVTINGHKEAGIFVEVEPGTSLIIQFAWESPANLSFDRPGEYTIFLRKQPGILDFPTKIKVNIPAKSLTQTQILEYNTELSRDYILPISW